MGTGAWPTIKVVRWQKSLDGLVRLVDEQARNQADDQVIKELSRFLVVRSCGLVEQVSEECCKEYLIKKSDIRSSSFAHSWFGRGANPSPGNLVSLVSKFDPEWGKDLQQFLDDDDELLKRQLDFLVTRRNKIAHGESEGVGVRKALDLSETAFKLTDWFIVTFNPSTQSS